MDNLTLDQYELLVEAHQLKQVDEQFRMHLQAYLNFKATAKKKSGKGYRAVYSNFKKFFDYDKELSKVKKKKGKKKLEGIGKLLKGNKHG